MRSHREAIFVLSAHALVEVLNPEPILKPRFAHFAKLCFSPLFDVDPESLLDQPFGVFWEGEKTFFQGTAIVAFDASTRYA